MDCISEILVSLRESRLSERDRGIKGMVATDKYKRSYGQGYVSREPIRDALEASVLVLVDTSSDFMKYINNTPQEDMTFKHINMEYLQPIDTAIQSIRKYLDPRRKKKGI